MWKGMESWVYWNVSYESGFIKHLEDLMINANRGQSFRSDNCILILERIPSITVLCV